jgi:hypothetical protein
VKIDPRFCDQNRIPVLVLKSVSDFHLQTAITIAIGKLIRIDRDPNFILKSIRDFPEKQFLFNWI